MDNETVTVRCPDCGAKLSFMTKFVDKKISCPACNRIFSVTTSTSAPAPRPAETRFDDRSAPSGGSPGFSESNSGTAEDAWRDQHVRPYSDMQVERSTRFARNYRKIREDDRHEAMQSIGIFLMIMAFLATMLPLFDLRLGEFASSGILPILMCFLTAICGAVLLIVSQRRTPVIPVGISAAYLLIMMVIWCVNFDFYELNTAGLWTPRPQAQSANIGANENSSGSDTTAATNGGNSRDNNSSSVNSENQSGKTRISNLPVSSLTGVDDKPKLEDEDPAREKKPWEVEKDPLRPSDIVVPDDYNSDDDNFLPSNIGFEEIPEVKNRRTKAEELADRIRRGLSEDTVDLDYNEKTHVRKALNVRKIIEGLSTEPLYRGRTQRATFAANYSLSPVVGTTSASGTVYYSDKRLIGVDSLSRKHTGGMDVIAPIFDIERALDSSLVAPAGTLISGFELGFNNELLVGIKAHFSKLEGRKFKPNVVRSSDWQGYRPRQGKEKELISDGRPIYGLAVFETEMGIVGLALLYKD